MLSTVQKVVMPTCNRKILYTFANIMHRVCYEVEVESSLQLLEGERFYNKSSTDDDARLDIKANSLWWSRLSRTFLEVNVFNPLAKSFQKEAMEACICHEAIKNAKYGISEIERSHCFVPLLFPEVEA